MESAMTGPTEKVASDVQGLDGFSKQINHMEIRLAPVLGRVLSQQPGSEEQEPDKASLKPKKELASKKPDKKSNGTRKLTFREFLGALWW